MRPDKEAHLRQRVTRGWIDDEDIIDCMVEIDLLRASIANIRNWAVKVNGASVVFASGEEYIHREDIIQAVDRLGILVDEVDPTPPIPPNRECEQGHPVVCMPCYEADAEAYAESRYEQ